MSFQNIYYERKVGTARPCYVCRRPTTTVLATIKTEDFLYTCDGHLSDVGFATALATPPPGPTPDDIRKVVDEYRARESRRSSAETSKDDKDKDKDKEKKESGGLLSYLPSIPGLSGGGGEKKDDEKKGGSGSGTASPAKSPAPISPVGVPSTSVAHRKFELHRAIFASRRAEAAKKQQTARAKEVSKVMPQAPRGSF